MIENLDQEQINEALLTLNKGTSTPWEVKAGSLNKEFVFKDFATAFAFMTQVANLAEQVDHHPDWSNSYNRVEINLQTHESGAITLRDFNLANQITNINL